MSSTIKVYRDPPATIVESQPQRASLSHDPAQGNESPPELSECRSVCMFGLGAKVSRNEVVLSIAATKLPLKDLLPLRLTCSMRNQMFVPEVQKQATVVLNRFAYDDEGAEDTEELGLFLGGSRHYNRNHRSGHYVNRLNDYDYTELMKTSTRIPFAKYKIYDLTDTSDQEFHEFFSTCAGSIRSLCLKPRRKQQDVTKLRKVIFDLTPELEYLDLHIYDEREDALAVWDHEYIPMMIFGLPEAKELPKLEVVQFHSIGCIGMTQSLYDDLLMDLVRSATNLKSLQLDNVSDQEPSLELRVLGVLKDPARHQTQLKELKITGCLTLSELQLLADLAHCTQNLLRLKAFAAHIRYDQDHLVQTDQLLTTFLHSQALTLSSLDITLNICDLDTWRTRTYTPHSPFTFLS